MGIGMWGYIVGMTVRPRESKETETEIAKWDKENAQILTWFRNSVQPSIGMNFSKYNTAKEVWDHLKTMYLESNFAKQYELEMSTCSAIQ